MALALISKFLSLPVTIKRGQFLITDNDNRTNKSCLTIGRRLVADRFSCTQDQTDNLRFSLFMKVNVDAHIKSLPFRTNVNR